jgi:hypothetical protein
MDADTDACKVLLLYDERLGIDAEAGGRDRMVAKSEAVAEKLHCAQPFQKSSA